MFKIGDFSRIARVSCRLLRYYDELGLLKPAIVDSTSGYRFYGAEQLTQINRILVLKELGLSLEQIVRVVAEGVSPEQLRAMLLLRRSDAEQAVAAEAARLRQIEARIAQLDVEDAPLDDVLIRAEPAQRVLTLRRTLQSFGDVRELIRQLIAQVPRRVPKPALGAMIGIAHAPEFEPDAFDVEVGYVLHDAIDEGAWRGVDLPLQVRELAGAPHLAACVRVGPPDEAHRITAKIGRFVAANGYMLDGPGREVFVQPPQPDRWEQSVVEMVFPLARR